MVPPPLNVGLSQKSKVPSKRGGLDLGHLRKSKVPSRGGGVDLGLSEKSNPPLQEGGVGLWTSWDAQGILSAGHSPRQNRSESWQKRKILLARCAREGHLGSRRGGLDLGLSGKSKVPSKRGGLDLGLFGKSKGPSRRGGLDLGLLKIV